MNTAKSIITDKILHALLKQPSEYPGMLLDVFPPFSHAIPVGLDMC
jgi:hypothetical protein